MLRVAIDVGPTHGTRTGIGNAVAWTIDALDEREGLDLQRYVTSARARLRNSERRIPMPAAVALRAWSHPSLPMDRWLGDPDVVHGTNYVIPPTHCPRVVSVYDCWFLEHPEDAVPDVLRAAAVLRRAVADGANVVTSSDATTRRVRELLDTERVRTVLLGPPPPDDGPMTIDTPAGLPDLDVFILALGTIERRKNLPTLIDAFGRLAREHAAVRLVIAGAAGNDVAAVDRAIARLSPEIAERVVRTGIVDNATKRWLLTNARALAYPSLDEGFGFPVLEAQAAGTPVVASDVGSVGEVAGDGAVLVADRSPEPFAEALDAVLAGRIGRLGLIEAGHRNVRRFSWAATVDRLADLYDTARDASR